MTVIGADPDQLRATANQFVQAADRLQGSLAGLNSFVANAAMWRGPDSERFRSEWNGRSVFALNAAISALRTGAEVLRRNADEQENASRADGGGIHGAQKSDAACYERAPRGLNGVWDEVHDIPGDSSGYRVQKVVGADGIERYIVYIVGTDMSTMQTEDSFWGATAGAVDVEQYWALKRLIPQGSEVMLVGYSQGGVDAQNIAEYAGFENAFDVKQIVTFGSPVHQGIDAPAIHLIEDRDPVPGLPMFVQDSPYSHSAPEGSDNVEVFSGRSEAGHSFFGDQAHARGYESLSEKWDNAAREGTDARAAKSAENLKKFQGDVVGQVDIGVQGDGSW